MVFHKTLIIQSLNAQTIYLTSPWLFQKLSVVIQGVGLCLNKTLLDKLLIFIVTTNKAHVTIYNTNRHYLCFSKLEVQGYFNFEIKIFISGLPSVVFFRYLTQLLSRSETSVRNYKKNSGGSIISLLQSPLLYEKPTTSTSLPQNGRKVRF